MSRRGQASRLTKTREKQNKKQIITFAVSIVVVIILLFEFGPPLVNFLGNAVYNLRGANENTNSNQISDKQLLQPPAFNDIPDATQSASISFTGVAPDINGAVQIYVNDYLTQTIDIGSQPNFNVSDLSLENGTNTIKARFKKNGQESQFTKDYQVNYISQKPSFKLTSPSDGQTFTRADQQINVTGTTDPNNTITVNGHRAIVDSSGNFSYFLGLSNGDNTITIEAQNQAGLSAQQQIKVTYNP